MLLAGILGPQRNTFCKSIKTLLSNKPSQTWEPPLEGGDIFNVKGTVPRGLARLVLKILSFFTNASSPAYPYHDMGLGVPRRRIVRELPLRCKRGSLLYGRCIA